MKVTTPDLRSWGYPGETALAHEMQKALKKGGKALQDAERNVEYWEDLKKQWPEHSISYKVGGPGQHGKEQRKRRGPLPEIWVNVKQRMLATAKSLSKRKVNIIREGNEARDKKRAKQAKEDPLPVNHISVEIGNGYHIRIVYIYMYR